MFILSINIRQRQIQNHDPWKFIND